MRGHLTKRGKSSWSIVLTLGRVIDPKTGKSKPNQKWITVQGTKKQAEEKMNELIYEYNRGEFVEPSSITTGEWLEKWIKVYVANSTKKGVRTRETYTSVVRRHLIPAFGNIPLQNLTASHIQYYYNTSKLSSSTLEQHHAILHQALKVASRNERLMNVNPAELVVEKPVAEKNLDMEVWTQDEVRRFLKAAREAGLQSEAFYTLTIESGMRRGEICGLKWEDVDLAGGKVSVKRTLLKAGSNQETGPPKCGRGRSIAISPQMVALLKRHKAEQNALKLRQGEAYADKGFVFTKDSGDPIQMNNFGQRSFADLIKEAGVKKIRFHDLRHTCATLLLEADTHPKVVQERLGHANISLTLDTYSHVSPTMQKGAAQFLGNALQI